MPAASVARFTSPANPAIRILTGKIAEHPLHPPGQETKLRDAHLPAIRVPMLFLQGTRDEFARLDLLKATVEKLGPHAELALFEDADHSFKTPRGAAATSKQTEAAVFARLAQWLEALTEASPPAG